MPQYVATVTNRSCPVILSVDASSKGFWALFIQESKRIVYASRALMPTQQMNAQLIKRHWLYEAQKFQQFIFGKTVDVESDHKPLEHNFNKPLHQASQK